MRRTGRIGGHRRTVWAGATGLVLAIAGWASVAAVPAPANPPTVTLSIVGTADLHGRVFEDAGRGGLALFGGYLANLRAARAADGGAVVLLDSGDTWQGGIESNLSEGALVVDAYNALGYTAAAPGNHDFEFGAVDTWDAPPRLADLRGALKARAAQAQFPFLAANLIDDATGRPVAWPNVRPSAMVERAGVRIGLVGVMTLRALSMTLASNVGGLSVAPLAPAIAAEATALRAQGAQVVVVVAHAGGVCEAFDAPADLSSCDDGAEMFTVVRALPRGLVDAVVAGHTHSAVAHEVQGVPIVQAYYWGQWFSRVDLTVEVGPGRVIGHRIHPPREICARESAAGRGCVAASTAQSVAARYEGAEIAPDPAVTTAMGPALDRVRTLRATPLEVTLDAPLTRGNGVDDSGLGNLFADALRDAVPGADVAIGYSAGPGGLRSELAAGPLTRGALYDVFPFDNRVARLDLTADELRRLLADRIRRPRWRGRSLGVSGMVVTVDCDRGEPEVALARPDGEPFAGREPLVVATNDFLASWVGGGAAPEPARPGTILDQQLRDVVDGWVRGQGPTLATARFADPARPRWVRTKRAAAGCETP
jgi:2',3'-cyclic-nucleotide 2'-phosphodiesterase (5'-nucleotidase family)